MSVFRTTIKPLFVGQFDKDKSRIRRVEEKASKHQLKIALVKIDPATKQRQLTYCVVGFHRFEEMEQYEKEFNKVIEELKG